MAIGRRRKPTVNLDSVELTGATNGGRNQGLAEVPLGEFEVGCSERQKEIKRRRRRRRKLDLFKRKLPKATVSEKQHMADKLRAMTPGAEQIIDQLTLIER